MFIPYLGEKSKFSDFINPNIPLDISTYCEPFGGAFGIFFSLDLDKFPNTQFIYNDENILNTNLIKQLSNKEEFSHKLSLVKATEEKYYQIQKDLFNNNWTDEEKAINWLILLCCSERQYKIIDGNWKNDNEFEIFKFKLKFDRKLHKIDEILNQDYKEVIKNYDSTSTFFYLDPPYKGREDYYINHSFNLESHWELFQTIKEIKGRFALSYFHFAEMDEWYKDYKVISRATLMGTEYLIMNYSL